MIRPIETSLSLYNVEQKANQIKDQSAPQFAAMQHEEAVKAAVRQDERVPTVQKTESEVKVRDRKEGNKEGRGQRRGGGRQGDQDPDGGDDAGHGGGGLDFMA